MLITQALALVVLEKMIFFHYKPMVDIDIPWDVVNLDPRGMVSRIHEED